MSSQNNNANTNYTMNPINVIYVLLNSLSLWALVISMYLLNYGKALKHVSAASRHYIILDHIGLIIFHCGSLSTAIFLTILAYGESDLKISQYYPTWVWCRGCFELGVHLSILGATGFIIALWKAMVNSQSNTENFRDPKTVIYTLVIVISISQVLLLALTSNSYPGFCDEVIRLTVNISKLVYCFYAVPVALNMSVLLWRNPKSNNNQQITSIRGTLMLFIGVLAFTVMALALNIFFSLSSIRTQFLTFNKEIEREFGEKPLNFPVLSFHQLPFGIAGAVISSITFYRIKRKTVNAKPAVLATDNFISSGNALTTTIGNEQKINFPSESALQD